MVSDKNFKPKMAEVTSKKNLKRKILLIPSTKSFCKLNFNVRTILSTEITVEVKNC